MTDDKIDVFAQDLGGQRKSTIPEIVADSMKTGQSPRATYERIAALYPGTTEAEMMAAINAGAAIMVAEAKAAAVEDVAAFRRDFEAAVALDPYWEIREDGMVFQKPGATYDTPKKLVAAYRAGRLGDPR